MDIMISDSIKTSVNPYPGVWVACLLLKVHKLLNLYHLIYIKCQIIRLMIKYKKERCNVTVTVNSKNVTFLRNFVVTYVT